MDIDSIVVLFPIAINIAIIWWVYKQASSRDSRVPADDIGLCWLIYLNIYTSLPSFVWFLRGGVYGPLSPRLLRLAPTAADVFYLQSIVVCYAISFTAFYWAMRRRAYAPSVISTQWISAGKMFVSGMIIGVTFLIGKIFAVDVNSAAAYGESFRVIATLPLEIRQILKVVDGLAITSLFVFLVAILQRWPQKRFLLALYIVGALLSFDPAGSRGQLVTMLFALVLGWHMLVKPISAKKWFVGGMIGFLLFILMGVLRGLIGSGNLESIFILKISSLGLGEFDQVWSNAIELLHASTQQSLPVPFNVQYSEFFNIIPSQLLPFGKNSFSIWFLDEFYPEYKMAGGGWAFGALAQAVVSGGLIGASILGAFFGWIMGMMFRYYRNPRSAWWTLPVYLYLVVFGFDSIRDTILHPVLSAIQIVCPSLFIIALLGSLVNHLVILKDRTGKIEKSSNAF